MVGLFAVAILVHPQPPLLATGSAAPAMTLSDAGGHQHVVVGTGARLPALIEFMSAGCATCRSEAADLCRGAASSLHAAVFAVDAGADSAATVSAFQQRYLAPPCTVPVLLDPGLTVSKRYEVGVVPTVYVVDSNGRISYAGYGAAGVQQALADVARASGG